MLFSAKNAGCMYTVHAHVFQAHHAARRPPFAMGWKVGMVIGVLLAGSWCLAMPRGTAAGWGEVASSCPHPGAAAGEMRAPHRWALEYLKPPASPSIRARDITERLPKLPHDLRRPRPPRHRSERPSTGLALLGELMIAELLEFLDDPRGGRFVPFPVASLPLPGHPSAILRPPSPRG